MTLSLSPRLRVYTALAATALIGALAFGRPDLAVLATPFVVLLGVAFMGAPLALDGRLELERERVLEGESVRATLTVRQQRGPRPRRGSSAGDRAPADACAARSSAGSQRVSSMPSGST